jgi:hypothetical protein
MVWFRTAPPLCAGGGTPEEKNRYGFNDRKRGYKLGIGKSTDPGSRPVFQDQYYFPGQGRRPGREHHKNSIFPGLSPSLAMQ